MIDGNVLIQQISSGNYDGSFISLYGKNALSVSRTRYIGAVEEFTTIYRKKPVCLFSAPGRTEIGGNHTDHQNGRVLAAAVDLDAIAAASCNDNNTVRIVSEGYGENAVVLDSLVPLSEEAGEFSSLIRGICARFSQLGYKIGGIDIYMTSDVPPGSGLSSSAAFEVLICTIINHLYNEGKIAPLVMAKTARYAENVFFGKPSGLMDQTISAVGGLALIDFADPENPIVEKIDFDFANTGYTLCIVDCGGSHADLTADYAAITGEMRIVAQLLGCEKLGEADNGDFIRKIAGIRHKCSERAILRAAHFFNENNRVTKQVKALKDGDFERFKNLIIQSGESSYKYLQNIYSAADPENQCVSLALMLSETMLSGKGAWRVHGGGFGGTIQVFVPDDMVKEYMIAMEEIMGKGSCKVLKVRFAGGVKLVGE